MELSSTKKCFYFVSDFAKLLSSENGNRADTLDYSWRRKRVDNLVKVEMIDTPVYDFDHGWLRAVLYESFYTHKIRVYSYEEQQSVVHKRAKTRSEGKEPKVREKGKIRKNMTKTVSWWN